MEKRFQECNWLEKTWRYRWYLALPFMYLWMKWYSDPIPEVDIDEDTGEQKIVGHYWPDGKTIWRLCIGIAQGKMKWYYTMDEVKDHLNEKLDLIRGPVSILMAYSQIYLLCLRLNLARFVK